MAMTIARIVTMVEIVPVTARPPVEKIAPRSGVSKVVPQVGQPAPRAMSPATMPALPRLPAFCSRFLFQSRTMRPIRMPCKILIRKIGSQSRKGWPTPKIPMKFLPSIPRASGKPRANIRSNLEVPPARRFISSPKNKKVGIKPYQKRFSLVASKIPLPAITKLSNHFLQFIMVIITYIWTSKWQKLHTL